MPRLTQRSAQARREEIVSAAIRVMARKGVARTSMADIIAESGLSSGSIYSHFSGRSEIWVAAAAAVIGERAQRLVEDRLGSEQQLTPLEIVESFVAGSHDVEVPSRLVLQMWAEATVDEEVRGVVEGILGGVRSTYLAAVTPWARLHELDPEVCADGMLLLAQGHIAGQALGVSEVGLRDRARAVAAFIDAEGAGARGGES